MELSNPKTYFVKKKIFLYFGTWNFLALMLKISGGNFSSSKNKNNPLWKSLLYFGKWNFLVTSLKEILYFSLKFFCYMSEGNLQSLKNKSFLYILKKKLYI